MGVFLWQETLNIHFVSLPGLRVSRISDKDDRSGVTAQQDNFILYNFRNHLVDSMVCPRWDTVKEETTGPKSRWRVTNRRGLGGSSKPAEFVYGSRDSEKWDRMSCPALLERARNSVMLCAQWSMYSVCVYVCGVFCPPGSGPVARWDARWEEEYFDNKFVPWWMMAPRLKDNSCHGPERSRTEPFWPSKQNGAGCTLGLYVGKDWKDGWRVNISTTNGFSCGFVWESGNTYG